MKKTVTDKITPGELEKLRKVKKQSEHSTHAAEDAELALQDAKLAMAFDLQLLTKEIKALARKHRLGQGDAIDTETGVITRKEP